ncbi:hypothetical protein D3C72_917480 [compost metagenome]
MATSGRSGPVGCGDEHAFHLVFRHADFAWHRRRLCAFADALRHTRQVDLELSVHAADDDSAAGDGAVVDRHDRPVKHAFEGHRPCAGDGIAAAALFHCRHRAVARRAACAARLSVAARGPAGLAAGWYRGRQALGCFTAPCVVRYHPAAFDTGIDRRGGNLIRVQCRQFRHSGDPRHSRLDLYPADADLQPFRQFRHQHLRRYRHSLHHDRHHFRGRACIAGTGDEGQGLSHHRPFRQGGDFWAGAVAGAGGACPVARVVLHAGRAACGTGGKFARARLRRAAQPQDRDTACL